eukprot:2608255-Pyramimonas_sp.AAC.1
MKSALVPDTAWTVYPWAIGRLPIAAIALGHWRRSALNARVGVATAGVATALNLPALLSLCPFPETASNSPLLSAETLSVWHTGCDRLRLRSSCLLGGLRARAPSESEGGQLHRPRGPGALGPAPVAGAVAWASGPAAAGSLRTLNSHQKMRAQRAQHSDRPRERRHAARWPGGPIVHAIDRRLDE